MVIIAGITGLEPALPIPEVFAVNVWREEKPVYYSLIDFLLLRFFIGRYLVLQLHLLMP